MKNYRKIILASCIGATLIASTSCRDDFSDINSNPSQITKADPSYLFAQACFEFDPCDYTYWFYDAPMLYSWNQMAVPTSSFAESFKVTTVKGGVNHINTLKYVREVEAIRSRMSETESSAHAATGAALDVISAILGIAASDLNGDIPFTEAANALHGGTLTPKYDRVADLYTLWLSQMDNAISIFTTAKDQVFPANQDMVYAGDKAKWAKLANSLKLKIAARLISQDRAKALKIAEEVASASCGYINDIDQDMLFNKATVNSNSDNFIYHWQNGFMQGHGASQRIMDFMVENKDPRVRFCYQKNSWNSHIVQEFYNQNKAIPAYIEQNVDYTVNADGKKEFKAWKGLGEPWVRYYGLPLEYNAKDNAAKYGDWYDYENRFKITDEEGKSSKTYRPYSMFQYQMIVGRTGEFTVPTVPGGPVITRTEQRPWYGLYLGAGEVNLYLAEFALLGASLPQSAESYYTKGLEMSVREYDRLAEKNKIAYYKTTYDYDSNEKSIELKDGEIEAMLESAEYQLTGSKAEQLEKVYLQQMLNFTLYPYDAFITSRRAGLPKFNSSLVARQDFSVVPVTEIPRRMHTDVPNETNLMYNVLIEAFQAQGYTPTAPGATNTSILNSERAWQDKGAPQWGEGPQM